MNWEDSPPFTEIFIEFRGTKIEAFFDDKECQEKIRQKMLSIGGSILSGMQRIFDIQDIRSKFGSDDALNHFKKKYLFSYMIDICNNMKELNMLITEVCGTNRLADKLPLVIKYIIEADKNFQEMLELSGAKK